VSRGLRFAVGIRHFPARRATGGAALRRGLIATVIVFLLALRIIINLLAMNAAKFDIGHKSKAFLLNLKNATLILPQSGEKAKRGIHLRILHCKL
jgi:hypothetical protein